MIIGLAASWTTWSACPVPPPLHYVSLFGLLVAANVKESSFVI